jgi:hypothetical protein
MITKVSRASHQIQRKLRSICLLDVELTSLKIVLSEFDLAVIVRACQCLEILEIFETYGDQDIHFRGRLAGLSHLGSVNIILDGDNHGLDTFFPVSSASTLNHFALMSDWADYISHTPTRIDTVTLDKFVNLDYFNLPRP